MALMKDRVAVVTGAGRGIGQAIAVLFAEHGAKVVVNDVDAAPAEETVRLCRAQGALAIPAVGSITDPRFTDAMMREGAERFGGSIDVLVNNAGITRDKVVHKMTDEDWRFVIDVNLTGTFHCIRSVAPWMRDVAKRERDEHGTPLRHRKIVNFFSTAAIRGNPGQVNYTAAKMGNIGITRTVAQEWGPFWINVNAVAPGLTDTRLTQPKEDAEDNMGIPRAQKEAMVARIPFGRAAQPLDIARVVLFFSSPLSDFVTGQEINVSGGMQIP